MRHCGQAALHADIDMVQKDYRGNRCVSFIPPLQVDFVDDAATRWNCAPKMFLQWASEHYVILQRNAAEPEKAFR